MNKNIYTGQIRIRGRGLGNIFGRIFRSSIPYLKTLGQYAKNQLFNAGAGILTDLQNGVQVKEALKKNARSTKEKIVADITKKLSGRGNKRRKKQINKKKSKRTKTLQKNNKLYERKRKKIKKSKRDNSFDLF